MPVHCFWKRTAATCLLLAMHLTSANRIISAAPGANWMKGSGDWSDAARWNGPVPGPRQFVAIQGQAQVTIAHGDALAGNLDVGTSRQADVTLTISGGTLTIPRLLRLSEDTGTTARLFVKGGEVAATSISVGPGNQGTGKDRCGHGTLEHSGGTILARDMWLAAGSNSTGEVRLVGSASGGIVLVDGLLCGVRDKGAAGSTITLAYDLDAEGVAPIQVWSPGATCSLVDDRCQSVIHLRIALKQVPPSDDVFLIRLAQPCRGTFTGLPEGSTVRATFAGQDYEWILTYRGGPNKSDIALIKPHVVGPDGQRKLHSTGKAAKVFSLRAEQVEAMMRGMIARLAVHEPPLTRGTPAFPGAEGFGAQARGGRGGKVIYVTNLNDSGPGSFREAVMARGPRTVLFRVGGVIKLKTGVTVREPFLTIAGQTAPGEGICLQIDTDSRGDGLAFSGTHDFVVRYLRVQHGKGRAPVSNDDGGDCISVYDCDNFILDHCSTHWGTDETLSVTGISDRYTVQWCLMAHGLNYAKHSMGSILGGQRCTWHHNLYAHCRSRNPRFAGMVRCDFRNNVIYNWGDTTGYGECTMLNYMGNYLRPGPSSRPATRDFWYHMVLLPGSTYLSGNIMDGRPDVEKDNWLGVKHGREGAAPRPFIAPAVNTRCGEIALDQVLQDTGATLPKRDGSDARVINDVRNRTGKVIATQEEVGGHPQYQAANATVADTDGDGIPDEWEKANGLDPNDPADGTRLGKDGYTNLERYLNSLVPESKSTARIVLVGDSTVTDDGGWGLGFKYRLLPDVECINAAASGRSSRSYRSEGKWEAALAHKPDFVLIQFGHNDQPGKGAERETDPATTYRDFLLQYVREAGKAGARPVLVTSMTRRRFGPDGKIKSDLIPYVEAVKKVAAEERVPILDLHALSINLCNELGQKACDTTLAPLHKGEVDGTHLSARGGEIIGALVARELAKIMPELASRIK